MEFPFNIRLESVLWKKIAIIGAGLSGLSLAHLLKNRAEVIVFEKSRGVGGRMSIRRAEPYFFDHGAQYFTIRDPEFQSFIQPLIDTGVVQIWNSNYVQFEGPKVSSRQWQNVQTRYVGVPGMNQIAKHLAQGLEIHLSTKVISIEQENGLWQLCDDTSQIYKGYDWLISTAPCPQTVEIFPKNFSYYSELKSIEMKACFALMLGFSEDLPFIFDAAHIKNSDLSWLCVNHRKPGRSREAFSLLAHSSDDYAQENLNNDSNEIMGHLFSEIQRITGHNVSGVNHKALHCWRYANNAKFKIFPAFVDPYLKLSACGDWSVGGRVEGAFLSAHKVFKFLSTEAVGVTSVKTLFYEVDYIDEVSMKKSVDMVADYGPVDLIIVAIGILHDGQISPERSIKELSLAAIHRLFEVNTVIPSLMMKYFMPLMNRDRKSVFVALSARIGSISDNRLGGWYSYRASKAALNMMIRTASIEQSRRNKEAVIIGLHPGTVDSNLSKPFQRGVPKDKLFTPIESCQKMLKVIEGLELCQTGRCFAWDGTEVLP